MPKGSADEAEMEASQHAVGGRARVLFFLFIFIHQIKLFFFTFVSRPVDSTRPDQHFFFLETGGTPSALFLFRKTPRVRYKRPGGAILELFYGTLRGAFTPFFTVCTYHGYIYKATMACLQCLCCTIIHQVHLPHNMHINRCVAVAVQERLWTLTLRRTFPLPLFCLDWPSFDEGSQEDIHLILRFRYILPVSHMSTVYQ